MRRATLLTAAVLLLPAALAAQDSVPPLKEERPGLLAQARVSPDSALAVARRAVPGARVRSAELEREHGRLVYSYDLKLPGRRGIEEIQVDAMTGAVVSREHESDANERREQARDSAGTGR